ncbi:MAG: ChbG/HpnK family deacetylase [Erysipelotrichaceae bacterium]|nr:ChbG/HpnK family deacetylase [Erysipelotrichaceae bacterium]
MAKILFQGDDFGFTRAVTLGIVDSIDRGVLRNTGLFANMPSAPFAVSFMKDRPQACFGIDFNLVSGPTCADPKLIPHLVDEEGNFIRSGVRTRDPRWQSEEGRAELFPYEEVRTELQAQFDRFVELTGRKPEYLHEHSISSENYRKVIHELSVEHDIPYSSEIWEKLDMSSSMNKLFKASMASQKKIFDPNDQLNKDTVAQFFSVADEMLTKELNAFCCHPGYVDAELLGLTTLSLERSKDAQMMMSEKVAQWIKENNVELITYRELPR